MGEEDFQFASNPSSKNAVTAATMSNGTIDKLTLA